VFIKSLESIAIKVMTNEQIRAIKNGKGTVNLESEQYTLIKNYLTNRVVMIEWNHKKMKLILREILKPEIFVDSPILDSEFLNYVLLNPSHKGHEKVFELSVDLESTKFILTKKFPSDDFKPIVIFDDRTDAHRESSAAAIKQIEEWKKYPTELSEALKQLEKNSKNYPITKG
jgi:hypothetical protein